MNSWPCQDFGGGAFQERELHEQKSEEGRHVMSLNLSETWGWSGRRARQGSYHVETCRLGEESGFLPQEMEGHCWA